MGIEFYSVKHKKKVEIAPDQVRKVILTREGKSQRYALRGNYEGTTVVKFVNKSTFDSLDVPQE